MIAQEATALKVLVVDDSPEIILVASKFLRKMGHKPLVARSGAEALRLFETERPDLVLLDVSMPGMDGYETAAHIKAMTVESWVPLVFLTARTEDAAIARGIEIGGDDYLVKPISFVVLKAKLDAFARMLRMQRQLERKSAELENYYHAAEEEQRVATHLMSQLVHADMLCDSLLSYWIQPAHNLSGDLVAVARTPGGALHVLLADGTGHGLAASLNVLPMVDPFYAMSAKGYGVGAIAREVNGKLKRWLPVERFVAATLIAFDPRERLIEVWSGGTPPPFVLDSRGAMVYEFPNMHLPLGVLDSSEFDAKTELLHIDEACQLVMYSDGAIEAEDAGGAQFGRERLIDALRASQPDKRIDGLKQALAGHFGGRSAIDDISIAIIDCVQQAPAQPGEEAATFAAAQVQSDGEWRVQTRFTAQELRYLDVVPMLHGLIGQFRGVQPHHAQVFLILSELFNNALDHGLLRLDSRIKNGPDGMEQYLELREQRLMKLREASIDILLERITDGGRPMIHIRVTDSGTGFDYRTVMAASPDAGAATHGRGTALVRSLCATLEYGDCGNEVSALYQLTPESDLPGRDALPALAAEECDA